MDGVLTILQSKTGLILMSACLLILLERLFPSARRKAVDAFIRVARNLSLAGFNAALSPLMVIPISALAAQWALDWRPEWWSGWPGLIIDLLLLDLWIYWWHRANHELPILWRFHEVHHLDEFLDVTSAVRFHFGEVVLSAMVRAVVIFLLAVSLTNIVIFETLILISAIFHHSNLKLPSAFERVLSFVIVTPSIHWVHHHAIRKDTDSNYSTVLSLWDRVFGSRSSTMRSPTMSIGVEFRHDESLLRLITRPFRADK